MRLRISGGRGTSSPRYVPSPIFMAMRGASMFLQVSSRINQEFWYCLGRRMYATLNIHIKWTNVFLRSFPSAFRRQNFKVLLVSSISSRYISVALLSGYKEAGRRPIATITASSSRHKPDGSRWIPEAVRWKCAIAVRRGFSSSQKLLQPAGVRREDEGWRMLRQQNGAR